MAKFGLIGKNIAASGSPALFKAAYGGKYGYDLIDCESFKEAFDLFKKDYKAVNVTAPFKVDAFNAADQASEAAELCGSANMLIRLPGGKVLADNSDFEGVTLSLLSACAVADIDVDMDNEDELDEYFADKTALIVGCGGAGKAAAAAAVTMGYGKTILMNRTTGKAEALKEHLCGFYDDLSDDEIEVRDIADFTECLASAHTVVYTLPESILPEGFEMPAPAAQNGGVRFVLEANYKTPCLEKFSGACTYISGLNWLFNQAVIAYEAFTGNQPDEEQMKKVL